ncbi:hypothetical protein [Helicobacter canis]|nr:hypothetical protein [Helicobacter canis]
MDSSIDRHAATIAATRDDKNTPPLRGSKATQAFHKKWILAFASFFTILT